MSVTLTVRLDNKTKNRLEKLAEATARTKSYLVTHAIEGYLEVNEWQVQEIKKALHEADQPGAEFLEHEEVLKKWEGKLGDSVAQKRKRRPR